jgi:hypothetical protein
METQGDLWPPRVGDYARLRQNGILGEVIDVACRGTDSRYTLNIFAPESALPSEYRLDDLSPAWPVDWT